MTHHRWWEPNLALHAPARKSLHPHRSPAQPLTTPLSLVGALHIDMDAICMGDIAQQIVQQLVATDQIHPDLSDMMNRALLSRHQLVFFLHLALHIYTSFYTFYTFYTSFYTFYTSFHTFYTSCHTFYTFYTSFYTYFCILYTVHVYVYVFMYTV